jgi:hypothetical protein
LQKWEQYVQIDWVDFFGEKRKGKIQKRAFLRNRQIFYANSSILIGQTS